ncbi:MAG: VCBS repeat-containing protein, partial [Hymenobacter sp.]
MFILLIDLITDRERGFAHINADVYAAGNFSTAGNATVNNVAKWDGTSWSSLGSGLNRSVSVLGIGTGGTIIAGGSFSTVGDGSKATSFFGIYNDVPRTILNSVSPASGSIGSSVQLTGVNLTEAASVSFNGTITTAITTNTATSLTVTVPTGATTGPITVTTALGTSNGIIFTVVVVPLTITAVSPVANARTAARTSPVQVTFNQALAASSAGALKVYSAQRGGLRTQGSTPAVVGPGTLTYTPPAARPFMPGETVQSTITTAATSSVSIALARPRVVQFTAAVAGTGRGIFSGTTNYSVPVSNGNTDHLAMGDVDGDGDLDMLTANDNPTGTVSVRFNNGAGTFSGTQSVAVDGFPRVVELADVDGDGDLDFLAVNDRSSNSNSAYGSSVSVRFNNGAGVFSGTQNVETGDFSFGLAIGDLDGDGDLDFATANYSSTDVRVRLN